MTLQEIKAELEGYKLEDIFGTITCVQIEGGHTGREEDTIWYYLN